MAKHTLNLKKTDSPIRVLGLMSGTSMDGLDMALCEFNSPTKPVYRLLKAKTLPYSSAQRTRLQHSTSLDGASLLQYHAQYAAWVARQVKTFLGSNKVRLIAFHGPTLFHQPKANLSFQLGSGAVLAALTQTPVVSDFRALDVALGGEGAPLVPQGDRDLFSAYPACLNIGGFANISMQVRGQRRAFDIVPVNYALNRLCAELKKPYDRNGGFAAQGHVLKPLFKALNANPFYAQTGPKSLGREWFDAQVWPLLNNSDYEVKDRIRTFTEHSAYQIARVIKRYRLQQILVTGGGTLNQSLLKYINRYAACELMVPERPLIHFKEALVFAWLGLLRFEHKNNTLKSVTGAKKNSSGGALYWP